MIYVSQTGVGLKLDLTALQSDGSKGELFLRRSTQVTSRGAIVEGDSCRLPACIRHVRQGLDRDFSISLSHASIQYERTVLILGRELIV